MKKALEDKKVNRNVKKLNKQIREDVFGSRFEARQIKKSKNDGIHYYQYMLIDNEQPERNEILKWYSASEIYLFNKLFIDMNNFIITSDFWSKYNKGE